MVPRRVLLLMGLPGCGKSTLARCQRPDYAVHIDASLTAAEIQRIAAATLAATL